MTDEHVMGEIEHAVLPPQSWDPDGGERHEWLVRCSCGWGDESPLNAAITQTLADRHVATERLAVRLDTETNRQAILAHVKHKRSQGSWPTAFSAAGILAPTPRTEPGEVAKIPREFSDAVRTICRRMHADGVLTFSAHGYLGVGENAPF